MNSTLRESLDGKIFYPGTDAYSLLQKSFFTAQQAGVTPACIVRCTTRHEVASLVKDVVSELSAAKIAVRGGGHSTLVGSANIEGGITLDMRSMNKIEVDQKRMIVSVGAGALWGDVYKTLDPLHLCACGGHGHDVGVAGFVLGGGVSPFSPRYGFSCDMVNSFEVVIAGGKIVDANAQNNVDLFQALKGGLNNFGIVTKFDLNIFPTSRIWGGYIVSPLSTLDESITALANLADDWDPHAAVEQSLTFSAERGFSVVHNMEYTKEISDPDILKPFASQKPLYRNTMRLASLTEIAKENQQLQAVGIRQVFCTTAFYLNKEHLKAICGVFQTRVQSVKDVEGMRWTVTFRRLHKNMAANAAARGENSVGLGTPEGPLVICVLTYSWNLQTGDEQMKIAAQEFIKEVDALSQTAGLFHPFKYLNYAAEFQNPINSMNSETLEFMRKVSAKYDPSGVFQSLVPGGFKIRA